MTCDFTFRHYENILRQAKEQGYEFVLASELFEDPVPQAPFIAISHDIDHNIDINNVEKMMEVERNVGIRTNWFFRLHAKYNPLFYKAYDIIRKLTKAEHEVGLHIDTDFYGLFGQKEVRNSVFRDVNIFRRIVGGDFKVANVHNKSGSENGGFVAQEFLEGLSIHFCDYTVVRAMGIKYLSDSSNAWREGCICKWIERGEPKIYATIHPSWWQWRSSCENY